VQAVKVDEPTFLDSLTEVLITIPHIGAHGILIPGGQIITRAHCIESERDYESYPHNKAFAEIQALISAVSKPGSTNTNTAGCRFMSMRD
jgi:hypothetical protein